MTTREELVKAVKDAAASWAAVDAADAAYDAYAAGKAYAVWYALNDAQDALKAYDKESNDSFHNFAECLCESYQREELVKAVDETRVIWLAAEAVTEEALDAYDEAKAVSYAAHLAAGVDECAATWCAAVKKTSGAWSRYQRAEELLNNPPERLK